MGSEMCIRDRLEVGHRAGSLRSPYHYGELGLYRLLATMQGQAEVCLLYTSDAADDLLCVDLGGRRLIKKKKRLAQNGDLTTSTVAYLT